MINAIQFFIRGFEDGQRGGVIRDYLERIGAPVREAFDGGSDSLGGLIETEIVEKEAPEQDDPETVLADLRRLTGFNGVWPQTREYRLAGEEEFGREDDQDEQCDDCGEELSAYGHCPACNGECPECGEALNEENDCPCCAPLAD